LENSSNKCGSFDDVMEKLWKGKEETGDFVVKSNKDKNEKRYHKIVLTYLAFFNTLLTSKNFKMTNEHSTNLSISSFDALMKYIYTGKTNQFGPLECSELLQLNDGVQFYFASSKSKQVVTLIEILNENINKVNEENCLPTLLFALRSENKQLQQTCFSLIQEKPTFFTSKIDTEFESEDKMLLSVSVMKFFANLIEKK
jgi:hypothetical protein